MGVRWSVPSAGAWSISTLSRSRITRTPVSTSAASDVKDSQTIGESSQRSRSREEVFTELAEIYLSTGLTFRSLNKLHSPRTLNLLASVPPTAFPDESTFRRRYVQSATDIEITKIESTLREVPFSIQMDASCLRNGERVISVLAKTFQRTYLVDAVFTAPDVKNTAAYQYGVLDEVLRRIGSNHFVQLCTDNCRTTLCLQNIVRDNTNSIVQGYCISHMLSMLEQKVTEAASGASEIILIVRNSVHGHGPLSRRRYLLGEFVHNDRQMTAKEIAELQVVPTRWHSLIRSAAVILKRRSLLLAFFQSTESSAKTVERAIAYLKSPEKLADLIVVVTLLEDFEELVASSEGRQLSLSPRQRGLLQLWISELRKIAESEQPPQLTDGVVNWIEETASPDEMSQRARRSVKEAAKSAIVYFDSGSRMEYMLAMLHHIDFFVPRRALRSFEVWKTICEESTTENILKLIGKVQFPGLFERLTSRTKAAADVKGYVGFLASLQGSSTTATQFTSPDIFWSPEGWGEKEYPYLAQLARRFLALSPSIAPTESSFSVLRGIDTQQRQNMSAALVRSQMIFRFNKTS